MATLTSSHPSYVATILENKLFINVCNLPLATPLIQPEFLFPKGGLIRGRPLQLHHGVLRDICPLHISHW